MKKSNIFPINKYYTLPKDKIYCNTSIQVNGIKHTHVKSSPAWKEIEELWKMSHLD